MKAVVSGFTWLIDTIKMLFDMLMSVFDTIGMVFRYLLSIVDMAFNVILTFPTWLLSFAIITISISVAYIIIGRNVGKSG